MRLQVFLILCIFSVGFCFRQVHPTSRIREIHNNLAVTTGSKSALTPTSSTIPSGLALSAKNEKTEREDETVSDATNPFDAITKAGLAGILAITLAEAIFWALGYPAALIYYKITANEWIDVFSKDGRVYRLYISLP